MTASQAAARARAGASSTSGNSETSAKDAITGIL